MDQQSAYTGSGPNATLKQPGANSTQTLGLTLGPQVMSQNNPNQSQYSPQANYYQQLIKSAQQQQHFIQPARQQQQQMNGQLNGTAHPQNHQLAAQYSSSQQNSPQTASQQQVDTNATYNGLAASSRPANAAPIYAPKPTALYPQYTSGASLDISANQYQQRVIQQQSSPATMQPVNGLSVRQLPQPQINGGFAPIMSPQHQQQQQHHHHQVVDDQQRQQQQQMQQLIMSYQQLSNQQHQVDPLMHNLQHQVPVGAELRWPSQHLEDQRQVQPNLIANSRVPVTLQQPMSLTGGHRHFPNDNDRDSISTVSRGNQFDDRRSFTMRSQYTNANKVVKNSRRFSFLKLTGQAMRGILGLDSASKPYQDTNNNNLHRNIHLTSQGNNNTTNKQLNSLSNSAHKITAIDTGEDYYFKRKVFKYRLVILRLINLICASIVLLSPVAMLLIPKMEFLFNPRHDLLNAESSGLLSSSTGSENLLQNRPSGSITHAVGISQASLAGASGNIGGGGNKQQVHHSIAGHHQAAYFTPQPQWRISDCNSDCDGPLIGFVGRLIMLCVAYWAIFFRPQTATLPRIDFQRCLLTSMALLLTLAYWLFFIFRVFDKRFNDFELQYMTIVQFALSLLESLILLHYLAVLLLELRQRKKVYCLKVVRSPDGMSQYYSCGSLSIQKCAQFVLEKYHRNFKSFNALAEHQLQLEDQAIQQNQSQSHQEPSSGTWRRSGRSRPSSPANSHRGSRHQMSETLSGGDRRHHSSVSGGRRSNSRASRHRSRNTGMDRSASNSPENARQSGRSRQQVRTTHQLDVDASPAVAAAGPSDSSALLPKNQHQIDESVMLSENQLNQEQQQQEGQDSSNSGDQSSDATSRMKESSLETIKAANSTADLLNGQSQANQTHNTQATAATTTATATNSQKTPAAVCTTKPITANTNHSLMRENNRDETGSVRSVRSRKSTVAGGRSHHGSRHHSHHHHHNHHRERSSSRAHLPTDESYQPSSGRRHHAIDMHHQQQSSSEATELIDEHERKLRRRKFRLLGAVQDTFERLKRIDNDNQQQTEVDQYNQAMNATINQQAKQTLGPHQAARSLYPSIARSLQKYLRLTKQTGRHNLQSIYEHLAKCLLYGLSARTFIEKFTNDNPVWQQNETNLFADCKLQDSTVMYPARASSGELEINSWSLVCDTLLSRHIDSGTFFVLQQGQISLLVTVAKIPHLSLKEEVIDQKSCKFSLEPNSESAV